MLFTSTTFFTLFSTLSIVLSNSLTNDSLSISDPTNLLNIDLLIQDDPTLLNVSLPSNLISNLSDLSAFYVDGYDAYFFGRNKLYHYYLLDPEGSRTMERKSTLDISNHEDYCIPEVNDEACQCFNDTLITSVFADDMILVACGPRVQGRCLAFTRPSIDNKKQLSKLYFDPTNFEPSDVISSQTSSVVFESTGNRSIFYVGFEEDCERPFTDKYHSQSRTFPVPFISVRRLKMEKLVYSDRKSVLQKARRRQSFDNSRSQFVYGFDSPNFAYFVILYHFSGGNIETRIGRICHQNQAFDSYTEIPLRCGNYQIASSGTFFGDSLFLSFDSETGTSSVVCLYKLPAIEESFKVTIKDCFKTGNSSQLHPAFYDIDVRCSHTEYSDEFLCRRSKNQMILGRFPLENEPIWGLQNETITSIALQIDRSERAKNLSVLVLVTSKSNLIQVDVQHDTNILKTKNRFVWPMSEKNRILNPRSQPNLISNPTTGLFYLLTSTSIVQVPTHNCSMFTSCASCYQANRKSECRWHSGQCRFYQDVPKEDWENDPTCPPEVYSFEPTSGPNVGGTVLTLHGFNFGNDDPELSIMMGPHWCLVRNYYRSNRQVKCQITPQVSEPFPTEDDYSVNITVKAFNFTTSPSFTINGKATATVPFKFVKPEVYGIFPSHGPYDRENNILIYGKHLDTGVYLEAFIGGSRCSIIFRRMNFAVCRTFQMKPAEFQPNREEVKVVIDSVFKHKLNVFEPEVSLKFNGSSPVDHNCLSSKKYSDREFCRRIDQFINGTMELSISSNFRYILNPNITGSQSFNTIASGGTVIKLFGDHLNSSPFPVFEIFHKSRPFVLELPCSVDSNGTVMECHVPSSMNDPQIRELVNRKLKYLFRLNDQPVLLDAKFHVFPDPEVDNFITKTISTSYKILELTGRNLHPNLTYEIELKTGNETFACHQLTDIHYNDNNLLRCQINITKEAIDQLSDSYATLEVVVRVGTILKLTPGFVQFRKESPGPFQNLRWFHIVIIIFICFLICGPAYQMTRSLIIKDKRPETEPQSWSELKWKEDLESIFVKNSTEDRKFRSLFQKFDESEMIIDPRKWSVEHHLGSGNFGTVFKAFYDLPNIDPETELPVRVEVALKLQNSEKEQFHEFISEAETMQDFNHPNVMFLIGVTLFENRKPAIILPFMDGRDLKSYVSSTVLTVQELLDFGLQIASGMTYLSEQNTVHRDLALRNCMVQRGDPPLVRVADFGLTRVTSGSYYQSSKDELPFKWMAPEALKYSRFSLKSDVYSYGVTLWELLTRGRTPYEFLTWSELVYVLEEGQRLAIPERCPPSVYRIMNRCWDMDPEARPSFLEVFNDLYLTIQALQRLHGAPRIIQYQNANFRTLLTRQNSRHYIIPGSGQIISRVAEVRLRSKIGDMTFDPSRELLDDQQNENGNQESLLSDSLSELPEYRLVNYQPPSYPALSEYNRSQNDEHESALPSALPVLFYD